MEGSKANVASRGSERAFQYLQRTAKDGMGTSCELMEITLGLDTRPIQYGIYSTRRMASRPGQTFRQLTPR